MTKNLYKFIEIIDENTLDKCDEYKRFDMNLDYKLQNQVLRKHVKQVNLVNANQYDYINVSSTQEFTSWVLFFAIF